MVPPGQHPWAWTQLPPHLQLVHISLHCSLHLSSSPSYHSLLQLVWAEVCQGPLQQGCDLGHDGLFWKQQWEADREMPTGTSATFSCLNVPHMPNTVLRHELCEGSKPCNFYRVQRADEKDTSQGGWKESSAWCDWKPAVGNLQTSNQAYPPKQREGNQLLEPSRQGESVLHTEFSENTLKIYFKYIIKGSPSNF